MAEHKHYETILRYQLYRHDELPEEHKAAYRADGVDPDNLWSLVYSYEYEADAENMLRHCMENAPPWRTWKIVDAGQAVVIERDMIW